MQTLRKIKPELIESAGSLGPASKEKTEFENLKIPSSLKNLLTKVTVFLILSHSLLIFYLSAIPLYVHKNIFASKEKAVSLDLSNLFSADFLANGLIFIPIGAGFALFAILNSAQVPREDSRKSLRKGYFYFLGSVLFSLILSLASEYSQLFINFRVFSFNDVAAHLLGAVFGFLLFTISSKILYSLYLKKKPNFQSTPFQRFLNFSPNQITNIFVIFTYSILLTVLYASPFNEALSYAEAFQKLSSYLQLPFSLILRGPYSQALENIIQSSLLLIPLGFFLYLPRNKINKTFALMIGLSLSVGLEILQAFFKGHYCDVTSSLILFAGFLTGVLFAQVLTYTFCINSRSSLLN